MPVRKSKPESSAGPVVAGPRDFGRFLERWAGGCGSELCPSANPGRKTRVCLGRGVVPCDIVFVGEAPGESENALGKVFVGPAGKLLDRIIDKALGHSVCARCMRAVRAVPHSDNVTCGSVDHRAEPRGIQYAITNLTGCIPRNPDEGGKAEEPPDEAVMKCAPRLEEFIVMCNPKFVVAVGAQARDWLEQGVRHCVKLPRRDMPVVHIDHPARILRSNLVQQDLMLQRTVVILTDAADRYLPTGG